MIKDKNLSNSAIKVLDIYKRLLCNNFTKNELLNGFSEDTLFIYLSSLNKIGVKVSKNKETSKYFIEKNINVINFSKNDFSILAKIKKYISSSNSINDIIVFNNLLEELKVFSDEENSCKLQNIIDAAPFGIKIHSNILDLEYFIKTQSTISVLYNAPKSGEKNFILLPLYLKILNSKVYVWCKDSTMQELRCLKVDRIVSMSKVKQQLSIDYPENYAICQFSSNLDINKFNDFNIEIVKQECNSIIAKVYYFNHFEFMQKILSCGTECEVLEPNNMKEKIFKTIESVKSLYE